MATMTREAGATGSAISHLECSEGGERHDIKGIMTFCHDHHKTLAARYNIEAARAYDDKIFDITRQDMWRYMRMLPVEDRGNIVSLGEGMTPLIPMYDFADELGINLWFKDEGQNPGNSFKARGQSAAISMAKASGVKRLIIPTAGNAGSAMAGYAAAAGMEATVYMPDNTAEAFVWETRMHGATVHMIDGSIADCGAEVKKVIAQSENILDVSTFFEPYRLEGKKTMGFELAEQLGNMPDVVLYPTGGGTGLVGIWKAAQELQELALITGQKMPRMVAVQMEGCAPVVNTFKENPNATEVIEVKDPAVTAALGLRVPKAFAGNAILQTLRDSNGAVWAVSEDNLIPNAEKLMGKGFSVGPEGASLLTALYGLHAEGYIKEGENVVMLNTGGPYKYWEQMKPAAFAA